MKNVLIVLGHPRSASYCGALAEAYAKGVRETGNEVHILKLGEISFDPILHWGYGEIQELEPGLLDFQAKVKAADHIVFVYPTWWGGPPALLRALLERAVLPGFGFKYHKDSLLWDKLLKGKSARIITTMDAPYWYYRCFFGAPGDKMMKNAVLNFCGIRPVRFTHLTRLKNRSETWRTKMLAKMSTCASRDLH